MGARETVEVTGHLMDSGILSRVLDDIRDYGADFVLEQFDVGHEAHDPSSARITVQADDDASLQRLLMRLQTRGVNQLGHADATLAVADRAGVLPDGFYSTTDLETRVRLDGEWYDVENPEMDCGLVVDDSPSGGPRVRTVPISDVVRGMRVVVGAAGVRVTPPDSRPAGGSTALPQAGTVAERPQAVLVRQVADGMREARSSGRRLLWVAGAAVVHAGGVPPLAALVRAGWVDVLFAGNAMATTDIEAALRGPAAEGAVSTPDAEHGHEHRVRSVNTIRRAGSVAAAVRDGVLVSGVMHALVTHGKPFVLVGSVRDDGLLPDVHTDVVEGRRAMRAEVRDVGYCLMMAAQRHAVATCTILPASVPLVCVDIDPATVTRLTDRGAGQSRGIVTDVGLFLEQLALELVADYRRG
ncbi:ornithine cyclodeaminase family domain [Nocardioides xinjiangensis]|uniref:ornithine cyclodeaminase family domain n=1 Tax=Nocardioides xinjiangensis TaxID=2817376 RepID=UPI001B3069F5|nr:TIGR00300 family protein [Nocardioides sp. SYSU D00514]